MVGVAKVIYAVYSFANLEVVAWQSNSGGVGGSCQKKAEKKKRGSSEWTLGKGHL